LKLPNISKDVSGRNWRRKVEKTLNAATRTRDKLLEQSENESPRGKIGDVAFLTGVDSSENPLDNFNNKSVELLCAKYQPNTSIGKDALRKFFQSPRKSPQRRYFNSSVDNLAASYESKGDTVKKDMTKSHRFGGARFFAGSSEVSPKAAVTGYNPHGKVRTAFQQMQDESKALDRKLAKCERRKKEELMERIEKAETRQRDVQVRYNSIKAE
jgi:hypothetical protein